MVTRGMQRWVLAGWILTAAVGHAQMSTFPNPPPLPPPADSSQGGGSAPAQAPAQAAPDAADSTQSRGSGNSGGGSSSNPVTAQTLTSMSALDDKAQIQDGDTVSFRVIEDRDDAVTRVVTDTGEVDFPYIGRVKVKGKTCHQVALEVKKLLEVDYYKRATVIIGLDLIAAEDKSVKPKNMAWVMGEVKEVGPQELIKLQPLTVSQAIIRAGGFGDFADQRKVKVIHRPQDAPADAIGEDSTPPPPDLNNTKNFEIIDVKSVLDGTSHLDPVVRPGDYIIVPKKWINI